MEGEDNSDGRNYLQMVQSEKSKKRKTFIDRLNEGNH